MKESPPSEIPLISHRIETKRRSLDDKTRMEFIAGGSNEQ